MLIFYGVIMGIGLGVGYLTPVKNLMLWFAKGLATGIAFAGLSGNQLASFVVSHATDAAHRYSALIPIITVLYAVALASIIAVTLATKGKDANALSSR